MSELTFLKGKKKREELRLPVLHYVVADQWIDEIGMDAFRAWLKFHTWVDRTDLAEEKYGNKNTIPRSLESTWEALGMKKTKFYEKVVHPLWNYGLIDIVEWDDSLKLGQKPKNIIVYEYPQNNYELAVKPIEKVRDYKTDYSSDAAIFGRSGGRPKAEEEVIKSNRSQIQTVIEIKEKEENVDLSNRSQMQTVDRSQTKTVTVRKCKPINYTNTIFNDSNSVINVSNNLSIEDKIQKLDVPVIVQKQMIKNKDRLIDDSINIDEVVLVFQAYKNQITENEYALVLDRVLRLTKAQIGSISQVLESSIHKHLNDRNNSQNGRSKPIRVEIMPEYMEDGYEDPKMSQEESEAKRKEIEELLKGFKEPIA